MGLTMVLAKRHSSVSRSVGPHDRNMTQMCIRSKQSSYLGPLVMSAAAALDMDFTSGVSARCVADPEIMSRNTHTDERKLS